MEISYLFLLSRFFSWSLRVWLRHGFFCVFILLGNIWVCGCVTIFEKYLFIVSLPFYQELNTLHITLTKSLLKSSNTWLYTVHAALSTESHQTGAPNFHAADWYFQSDWEQRIPLSIKCQINEMCSNHRETTSDPWSLETLASTKTVAGAKKPGVCWHKRQERWNQ